MKELILPQLSDIQNLSSNSVPVSELVPMLSSEILNTDCFTFAKEEVSSNFNVNYDDFQNQILNFLLSDDLRITGKWDFGFEKNSSLKINTSQIDDISLTGSNSIMNVEYFNKYILSKIDDLSNYIYRDPHLFSHVGEIIVSLTLKTPQEVSTKYTGTWERLGNGTNFEIMVIGVGIVQDNTIESKYGTTRANDYKINANETGGQYSVLLNTSNILPHTHKFVGTAKSYTMKWKYRGTQQRAAATSTKSEKDDGGTYKEPYSKASTGSIGVIKIKGSNDISSKKIYGDSITLTETIYSENGVRIETVQSHNNIPPIIYAYMYRRIS